MADNNFNTDKLTDQRIVDMEPMVLFSPEVLDSLFRIKNKAERSRLQGLMEYKAKDAGVLQQFKSVIKAYAAIEKQLAAEYAKEAQAQSGIALDYDGQGRPLVTVDNFLKVIEADPKFAGLKFNLLTYSPEQERDGVTENGRMPMMRKLGGISKRRTTFILSKSAMMLFVLFSGAMNITRFVTWWTALFGTGSPASGIFCIVGRNAKTRHIRKRFHALSLLAGSIVYITPAASLTTWLC